MTTAPAFSLADLEALDAGAPGDGRERRFLCPLCGDGKPRDTAHRSLCANTQSGAWNCKRCDATGKLTDFWRDRPKSNPRELARHKRRQLSQLPDESPQSTPESATGESATDWREQLRGARSIEGTPAETYLRGRGISIEAAKDSGVLFAPNFYGKPAAVFLICDRDGNATGASGRYFDANATPKTRIAGTKRNGLFTTSGALTAPAIILTEAPLDALSLASAGYPAAALCGTSAPAWIHLACGLKYVLTAFDADEAGDGAADALAARLRLYGARCERLRPDGAKDWNEALQRDGRAALGIFVAQSIEADKVRPNSGVLFECDGAPELPPALIEIPGLEFCDSGALCGLWLRRIGGACWIVPTRGTMPAYRKYFAKNNR